MSEVRLLMHKKVGNSWVPVQQSDFDGSFQPVIEELDSTVLVHDGMLGVEQTLASSETRAVRPGPGTMTARTVTSPTLVRYENGRLLLTHAAGNGYGTVVHWGPQTLAPGLTVIFHLIPAFRPGIAGQNVLGWSTNGGHGDTASNRGAISLTYDASPSRPKVQISTLASASDLNYSDIWSYLYVPGQEVRVAIRHTTSTLVEYFIQSPAVANCGCAVGSNGWFKLGQTSGVELSGTVYPYIYHQYQGATQVLDVKVLSKWNPSPRHQQFDYERGKIGVHVPFVMEDPVTGLMVCVWNNGTAHVDINTKIRASVRLSDGTWTQPSTIIAAPGGGDGVHVGSLSQVEGKLWLTYWFASGATDGGIYRRRILTINSETGAITASSEQVLSGLEGVTRCLSFNPIITTDEGTLLLFYNNFGDSVASVARSTDKGNTWSLINMSPGGVPVGATAIYEPYGLRESNGAVGVYMRANTGNTTYYQRSTDDGLTWSVPTPVYGMPQPGSGGRYSGAAGPDGRNWIIGNNDKTIRRAITVWEVGDNANIRNSTEIYDPFPDTGADVAILTHYPSIAFHGDDLIACWANQTGSDSWIQLHTLLWREPLVEEAGGTGSRGNVLPKMTPRAIPKQPTNIAYGASLVPNMSVNNKFFTTLAGSAATVAAPLTPLPYETLEYIFIQGGTGNNTVAWDSIFQTNGNSMTLQTALGASNKANFWYNPVTNKWVLESFS